MVKESGCMDLNQSVGKQNYVQWLLWLSKFTRFVELILSQFTYSKTDSISVMLYCDLFPWHILFDNKHLSFLYPDDLESLVIWW